jgi:hypothetical protein
MYILAYSRFSYQPEEYKIKDLEIFPTPLFYSLAMLMLFLDLAMETGAKQVRSNV